MCWTLFLLFWWSISLWQDQINTWIIVTTRVVLQTIAQTEQFYFGHISQSKRKKSAFFISIVIWLRTTCSHCWAAGFILSEGALNSVDQFISDIARFYYLHLSWHQCLMFLFLILLKENVISFIEWTSKPIRFWRQKLFHLPTLFSNVD